jgi:hypothetical protein
MAMPKAPPEAPSPMMMQITGTLSINISLMLRAMASPWPLSSASKPGNAPGVSISVTMGLLNFSAILINRSAFR